MNILTPDDIKIIQMALQSTIDDCLAVASDQRIPLDPAARRDLKQILTAATTTQGKINKLVGQTFRMDEYKPGDENEFLTKPS